MYESSENIILWTDIVIYLTIWFSQLDCIIFRKQIDENRLEISSTATTPILSKYNTSQWAKSQSNKRGIVLNIQLQ